MKIFDNIENILKKIEDVNSSLNYMKFRISALADSCDNSIKTIQKQDKIIEDLIKDKAKNESFECVVYVPYRSRPVVIKDGKVLSDENMTSFNIDWSFDEKTNVTVRNE